MSLSKPDRRISSRQTFFLKRVFPTLWFGIISLVLLLALAGGLQARHPSLLLLIAAAPLLMMFIGYLLMRRLVFDLADDMYDEGDALRVRFGADEERIELANISNVSYAGMINPPRVTLTLRTPGRFGKEITFSPPRPLLASLSGRTPLVQELIERVDAARRR